MAPALLAFGAASRYCSKYLMASLFLPAAWEAWPASWSAWALGAYSLAFTAAATASAYFLAFRSAEASLR